MAKRKRLTPAQPGYLDAPSALELKAWAAPPIAQIAGDASTSSALAEVSAELAAARAEGRMLLRLPLDGVDLRYLERDRFPGNLDEMAALTESLRINGQRSPIEVAEVAPGRYGLISGWRRLTALNQLHRETGDARFGHVIALLRQPDTIGQAYVAMVEENEIRVGLSYFERARIVVKALERGVFPTEKAALQNLFSTASRAKRSKIGSFLPIVRKMGPSLRFPWVLPERLGLQLSRMIETEPDRTQAFLEALAGMPPVQSPEEELARLAALWEKPSLGGRIEPVLAVAPKPQANPGTPAPDSADNSLRQEIRPGVFLTVQGGWSKPTLILSGDNVGPKFREQLEAWLKNG